MFYLLENNRIIDSENYKEPYILSKDVIRNREVLFLTSFKDQVSVKGTIKKQSENVFDLIEEGDLVLIPFKWEGKYINKSDIVQYFKDDLVYCIMGHYFPDIIITIYKPNSKGDYIKVWEKKDNE